MGRPHAKSWDILEARFRANPDYELVSLERLPPPQQILLQELKKDPDVFGILRPVGPSGWGFKSVGQDTALLYLALQSAGQLPTEMTGTVRERRRQEDRPTCSGRSSLHRVEWQLRIRPGSSFIDLRQEIHHGRRRNPRTLVSGSAQIWSSLADKRSGTTLSPPLFVQSAPVFPLLEGVYSEFRRS